MVVVVAVVFLEAVSLKHCQDDSLATLSNEVGQFYGQSAVVISVSLATEDTEVEQNIRY